MQQADSVTMITRELAREFGSAVPPWVIADTAARAVRDLSGSIASEALPEMAVRLARVRLQEQRVAGGALVRGALSHAR